MTKEFCPRGHARTPENLQGSTCKICKSEWQRANYARLKDGHNARRRERRRNDPEWAAASNERQAAWKRQRYRTDPEYRARETAKFRARYHTDEEFRERVIARTEAYRLKLMEDPVTAAKVRETQRFAAHRRRREAGVRERNWGSRSNRGGGALGTVDPAAFLAWVDNYLARSGETLEQLAVRAESSSRTVRDLRSKRRGSVQLLTVVRFLEAADCGVSVEDLYPVDGDPVIPERLVRKVRRVVCGYGGCAEDAGHGAFDRFCPTHADELERLRLKFVREQHGKDGARKARLALARRRGLLPDQDDIYVEEAA